jgi:hypothetical protein
MDVVSPCVKEVCQINNGGEFLCVFVIWGTSVIPVYIKVRCISDCAGFVNYDEAICYMWPMSISFTFFLQSFQFKVL